MKTLGEFVKASHIPGTLIRAVVRQLGGWNEFKDVAGDVATYGANAGFTGFIYHTDTVKFAEKNCKAILEMGKQLAADIGSEGVYSMVASFNCLDGYNADMVVDALYNTGDENHTEVMNALAWFALEEVCSNYTDLIEQS